MVTNTAIDEAAIMAVLADVPDPEIPVVSVLDLGIVRGVRTDPPAVLVTPTYTGCPATLAIEQSIRAALDGAGYSRRCDRDETVTRLDDRLDQPGRSCQAEGVRHRTTERDADRRMPAMRLARHG